MILFVSGQYAGAQYLHPLLKKWSIEGFIKWCLIATGPSKMYWDDNKVKYKEITNYTSNKISDYIDLVKPKLIIISASANVELEYQFILEAKKKLIPTATFIDIWANYIERFKYKGMLIFPNHILAIDSYCRNEMIKEGIPKNLIRIIGQPYLESILKKRQKLGNKVLLASQPINKNQGRRLGFNEKDFQGICNKIVDIIGNKNILATKHPNEFNLKTKHKNRILWTNGNGIDDIIKSHTVLGMYSMQMVVGYLWGRKVASIQPGLRQKDPSILSRRRLIPRLKNSNEVLEFLNKKKFNSNNNLIKKSLIGSIKRLEKFCFNYLSKN